MNDREIIEYIKSGKGLPPLEDKKVNVYLDFDDTLVNSKEITIMTVKKVRICDICGKEFDKHTNGQAKIKIRDCNYANYDDWEHMKWQKYDVCSECTKRLITEITKERNDND